MDDVSRFNTPLEVIPARCANRFIYDVIATGRRCSDPKHMFVVASHLWNTRELRTAP